MSDKEECICGCDTFRISLMNEYVECVKCEKRYSIRRASHLEMVEIRNDVEREG